MALHSLATLRVTMTNLVPTATTGVVTSGTGTGAVGPRGPQGVAGDTGPAGPQGIQGPAGNDGAPGAAGAQGPQGDQGIQGPPGNDGLPGDQGIQGPAGTNGSDGAQGPQGIQGVAGSDGAPGPQGDQGIQGPPGNDGAPGAQGVQGVQGDQGIQGPPGNDGAQGIQGIQGPAGSDGAQGIQGIQGPAGNDGNDGATGLQGPQGDQGPAGFNGATGADGLGYGGISTTSLTVAIATQTLDLSSAAFAYQTGSRVRLAFDPSNYMEGVVSSLTGISLVVSVDRAVGSGTYGFWFVSLAGDVGADGAVGSAGSAGSAGAGYGGISTTSITMGTGSKVFTTSAGLAYQSNDRVRVSYGATNYMEGAVFTYVGTTLTVAVDKVVGSGTYASWAIGITGQTGTNLFAITLADNQIAQADVSATNLSWDVTNTYAVRLNYSLRRSNGFGLLVESGVMDIVMNAFQCLCLVTAVTTTFDPDVSFYGNLIGTTATLQYTSTSTGYSSTLDITSIEVRSY